MTAVVAASSSPSGTPDRLDVTPGAATGTASWSAGSHVAGTKWEPGRPTQGGAAMSLVGAKSGLSEREIAVLESEMRGRSKSTLVAYVLWFFLGMLGGHRFYLNRKGWVLLVTFIVGVVLAVVIIGLVILFIEGIFILIDAFRIPGFIAETNAATEQQVITEILAARNSGRLAPPTYTPTPPAHG
jgi:TM2 domain-containing membrane protein YozV